VLGAGQPPYRVEITGTGPLHVGARTSPDEIASSGSEASQEAPPPDRPPPPG